jgi:hypothetical protein
MPESFSRTLEKGLLAMRDAQRVRSYNSHTVSTHVAQPLPETLQTGQRAPGDFLIDAPVFFHARGEPHHLAQTIDDDELTVGIACNDHVEAVRSEIDSRQDIGERLRRGAGLRLQGQSGRCGRHAVKEEPHPHVVVAFGFRITNWAPSSPSR